MSIKKKLNLCSCINNDSSVLYRTSGMPSPSPLLKGLMISEPDIIIRRGKTDLMHRYCKQTFAACRLSNSNNEWRKGSRKKAGGGAPLRCDVTDGRRKNNLAANNEEKGLLLVYNVMWTVRSQSKRYSRFFITVILYSRTETNQYPPRHL